jgi:signal transduction histidine kinase
VTERESRRREVRTAFVRWHRKVAGLSLAAKFTGMFAMIAVVVAGDFAAGEELSFSIFYLLPIGYASWFVGRAGGMTAAVLSAVCWYSVEVAQHAPYSHPVIPVWNAGVRLGFFAVGVALVRSLKQSETRLARDVALRTRRLRAESERRRRLEREMMEVTAREHLRVTQDLHDGLGQYLSALAFHARILADDLREEDSKRVSQAERVVELVRTTNQIVRRLDRAIRVPEASDGLGAAVRALTSGFEQLTGIRCEVKLEEPMPPLDHFRLIMVYRIVQEALNNAVKHANPRTIEVSAGAADGILWTRVADDGRGLPPVAQGEPGSGLRTMRLRAELLGAELTVEPNPSGGCVVECRMPLRSAEASPENGLRT